jgi:hypothetical protein
MNYNEVKVCRVKKDRKAIPEEYLIPSEGVAIDIDAICEDSNKTPCGTLRNRGVDEGAIRAFGISQQELDNHNQPGHWFKTFDSIMDARERKNREKKVEE